MQPNLLKASALLLALGFADLSAAAVTTIPQSALGASTTYYTDSIGGVVLGRNDDGSTAAFNLGYSFTLFGTTYNSLFINNNGNLTFTGPLSDYVPTGPTGVDLPVVSAWFGDVDTRGALSGEVHAVNDVANQQLVVTWDNVGYYNAHDDKLASLQLVLRGDGATIASGEGNVGFFYKQMPWEVTNTSTTAAIGFGDGGGNAFVLEGTNQPGLNGVAENHHIWFNVEDGGVIGVPPVTAVPEPSTYALMGLGLAALVLRRRGGLRARSE